MEFTSTSAAAERFTQVRRGYDPAEVEAFQAEMVRVLGEYEARLADAIEQLERATDRLANTQVDEDAIHATFVEAVRTKEQMLDEAEAECRRLIADAEAAGIAIREQAERETESRVEVVRQAQLEALADVERMREQARRDLAEYRIETTAEIDHHFVDLTHRIEAAQQSLAEVQAAESELVDTGLNDLALRTEQAMLQLERRQVQLQTDLQRERAEFDRVKADDIQRARQLVSDASAESEVIRGNAQTEANQLIAAATERANELSRTAAQAAEQVQSRAAMEAEQLEAHARGIVMEATHRARSMVSAASDEADSIRAAAEAGAHEMQSAAASDIEREHSETLAEAQTRFRTAGDVVRDTRLRLEQAERTRAGVEMRAAAQAERLLADAVREADEARAEWEIERQGLEAELARRRAEMDAEVQRAVIDARTEFDIERASIETELANRSAELEARELSMERERMQAQAELAERLAAHTRDLETARERDEADLAERIAEAEWQVQRSQAQAQAGIESAERRAAAEVAEVHEKVERLRNTVHRLEEQFSGVAEKAIRELGEVVSVIDTDSTFAQPRDARPDLGGDGGMTGRFDDLYLSDPDVANKSRIVVDLTKNSGQVEVPTDEAEETEELPGFYEKRLAGLRERLRNAEDTA